MAEKINPRPLIQLSTIETRLTHKFPFRKNPEGVSPSNWTNKAQVTRNEPSAYKASTCSDILQSGCAWYDGWVADQITKQPDETFCLLKNVGSGRQILQSQGFLAVWREVCKVLSQKPLSSIDSIVGELFANNLLETALEPVVASQEIQTHARYLVFAVIGWQTMLFRPDRLSYPADRLGIVDETNGYRGHCHIELSQRDSAYKKPLHSLLMGFGLMLPPAGMPLYNSDLTEDTSGGRTKFDSKSFNAYLLITICDIRLVWTDSLACHLEFDDTTRTLYIFKYPSVCASNLHGDANKNMLNSTFYACARPASSDAFWATIKDIDTLLAEVLLSYRILFGMEKVSRQYFRRHGPFSGNSSTTKDNLLEELCARKRPRLDFPLSEPSNFELAREFPMLKDRLSPLLNALSTAKPRTFKQLWKDRRDSNAWSAFWLILLVTTGGVVLALVQVILQIVQIVQQQP